MKNTFKTREYHLTSHSCCWTSEEIDSLVPSHYCWAKPHHLKSSICPITYWSVNPRHVRHIRQFADNGLVFKWICRCHPVSDLWFSCCTICCTEWQHFDGTIPENLGNANSLESLLLQDNSLTGPIPRIQQGELASLGEFQLQNYQFTVTMDQSICKLRVEGMLASLSADCWDLANPVLEYDVPECCSICFPLEFQD